MDQFLFFSRFLKANPKLNEGSRNFHEIAQFLSNLPRKPFLCSVYFFDLAGGSKIPGYSIGKRENIPKTCVA